MVVICGGVEAFPEFKESDWCAYGGQYEVKEQYTVNKQMRHQRIMKYIELI